MNENIPGHAEESREFATRDEAWAFMHECDETNGSVVAGYPSLTVPYTVRYYRRERNSK